MEEQQLLPEQRRAYQTDEGESSETRATNGFWPRLRTRIAFRLESPVFHTFVISLITIDAACVLADLAYTFLTPNCNPDPSEELPLWLQVLGHISLVITTLFLVEIPLALWAFGQNYFNPIQGVPYASLHLFDAVIILVTFVLEVLLKGRERELAGLLILLRLWRLVKLVGGIAVGAGEVNEELSVQLADAERRISEQAALIESLKSENQGLREQLRTGE